MKIEEFFAGLKNIRPEFRSALFLAVMLVCQWQRQQLREDGSSYLEHLFYTAYQLYFMGMPEEAIIAALLHDILEDTAIDPMLILDLFGLKVYGWVMALSKKPKEMFANKTERLNEYHQRWIEYARSFDWTVIFGKGSDRLHNLITLHGLMHDPGKQKRIAEETIDFYVPFFRGEAKEIVPEEYHGQLDSFAYKMECYALSFLPDNRFVSIPA